mmetsp:Transcript_129712/g.416079  ORF Transcript_129712/g.416079 Transcript_129712/m.416079 type:complete len:324 (-) Transcript_129712:454-1425(-)
MGLLHLLLGNLLLLHPELRLQGTLIQVRTDLLGSAQPHDLDPCVHEAHGDVVHGDVAVGTAQERATGTEGFGHEPDHLHRDVCLACAWRALNDRTSAHQGVQDGGALGLVEVLEQTNILVHLLEDLQVLEILGRLARDLAHARLPLAVVILLRAGHSAPALPAPLLSLLSLPSVLRAPAATDAHALAPALASASAPSVERTAALGVPPAGTAMFLEGGDPVVDTANLGGDQQLNAGRVLFLPCQLQQSGELPLVDHPVCSLIQAPPLALLIVELTGQLHDHNAGLDVRDQALAHAIDQRIRLAERDAVASAQPGPLGIEARRK